MTNDEARWAAVRYHLREGNFTATQNFLGGPDEFDRQIVEWLANGRFDGEEEILAEALSCACMLGRVSTARLLLDNGVDPYSGMSTGLAGPHYAVSGGHLELLEMLLAHNIPLEVENQYGGTLLGQALWSAVNEPKPGHAEVIAALVGAGAVIEPGTLEWWNSQPHTNAETKKRVANVIARN